MARPRTRRVGRLPERANLEFAPERRARPKNSELEHSCTPLEDQLLAFADAVVQSIWPFRSSDIRTTSRSTPSSASSAAGARRTPPTRARASARAFSTRPIRRPGSGPIRPTARRPTSSSWRERLRQSHPSQEAYWRPMPEATRRVNSVKSKIRCRVEHVFAAQKDRMDLFIRSIGVARATTKIGMANLVYNIKRAAPAAPCRGIAAHHPFNRGHNHTITSNVGKTRPPWLKSRSFKPSAHVDRSVQIGKRPEMHHSPRPLTRKRPLRLLDSHSESWGGWGWRMEVNKTPVLTVFDVKQRLEVPLFQRQYVWNEEHQWTPLWEDIERKFREILDGNTEAPNHFLGAMVLDQKQTPTGHVIVRQVIDGQQRLTTLQIFLAAYRDFCRSQGCSPSCCGMRQVSLQYRDDGQPRGRQI